MFATGLWHSADLQHLDTGSVTAVCFLPPPSQLYHHHKPLSKQSSTEPGKAACLAPLQDSPSRQAYFGFPGHAQVVPTLCAQQVWHVSCASYHLHTYQRITPCMLCGHLSSLPGYLAGCSSDHPDGNPSQTGSVSDSTQFLEGSTSRETQMCGRSTDLDHQ